MKETPVDGRGVDPVKHNRPRETWANRRARKARGANAAKLQKDQTLGGEIDGECFSFMVLIRMANS